MRRALALLVVLLITFALVVRGVAAPLMHLHPDVPVPIPPVSVSHSAHDHVDCGDDEVSDAADPDDTVAAQAHVGHTKHKNAKLDHGKVCDSNGACCGPLVLSEATDGIFALAPLPEPSPIAVSAGVKPLNPDRPPSPSIA